MSFGSPYFTLPEFTYHKPKTLREALELLEKYGDEAKVMAGGVGLIPFMKERLISPTHVIDIKEIAELKKLEYKKGEGLTIGATITFSELEKYQLLKEKYRALYQAVKLASDNIIRNRATLIGNICEAIPWVDGPIPLIAYGAEVEIKSLDEVRRTPVADFIKGPVEIDLKPGEIVTSIHLPDIPEEAKSGFLKFNTGSEFALLNIAAYLLITAKKKDVRLVYGAISSKPARALEAEKILLRDGDLSALISMAAIKASEELEVISDVLASEDYRRHLIKILTMKLLKELVEEV
ncbi:MAG: xanthine dehydrogenase family protein subunit M [Nitrososphaeria archaeon]|nr:xanthine dehydrogenase family protein subunit M [Nitrososphaeria archaeon]MDW7986476.1 xanthine dehydrogenase family protein subunit M [Nitrososphaerota archaeon]